MDFNKFIDLLETLPKCDKVVRIRYKWFEGDVWDYENELLLYNGNIDDYEWENDWDEGQQFVEVVGCLALDLVQIPECFM